MKGHLSLLYGQGAPGATVNYVGKRPTGRGLYAASLGVGSFGMRRVEVDLDSPAGSLSYRLVFAGQDGDTGQANVSNDRRAGLAGLTWRSGNDSALHLEVEGQRNDRPFSSAPCMSMASSGSTSPMSGRRLVRIAATVVLRSTSITC